MEIFTRELESIVKREGVEERIPTENSSQKKKKNTTTQNKKTHTIVEIKNKIDRVKIRLSIDEQIISELEHRQVKSIQNGMREKNDRKCKGQMGHDKIYNIDLIGVIEGRKKECGRNYI